MRLLRSQRGEISLTGLLVAMSIFIVVLGATLGAFETFDTRSREEAARVDAEEGARVAIDRLSRELRNLAQPQADGHTTVERAGGYDLVFKTVTSQGAPTTANPANILRVRYCLGSAQPDRLYYQTQAWVSGSTAPTDAACPGTGWTSTRVVTDHITNRAAGQARPPFSFNSTTLSNVENVHADLFVNADPARRPKETELSSGVFLRNQNQPARADFTADTSGPSIVLNASPSADPEGQSLRYQFYDYSSGAAVAIPACASVVCTWTPGRTGTFRIGLTVTDVGGIAVQYADPATGDLFKEVTL